METPIGPGARKHWYTLPPLAPTKQDAEEERHCLLRHHRRPRGLGTSRVPGTEDNGSKGSCGAEEAVVPGGSGSATSSMFGRKGLAQEKSSGTVCGWVRELVNT